MDEYFEEFQMIDKIILTEVFHHFYLYIHLILFDQLTQLNHQY
jgi:hypothetical protein